jgi:enamine deaminase RidA (YjgF/YER057c/UK114 family)
MKIINKVLHLQAFLDVYSGKTKKWRRVFKTANVLQIVGEFIMRKIAFILMIFAVFTLLLPAAAKAEGQAIGVLLEIEGAAHITRADGSVKQAVVDDEVFLDDVIKTGADGRAFLFLMDGTEWTLSENAVFQVNHYAFHPEDPEKNKARYSVVSGAFRYVSGMIAKTQEPDIAIDTSVGSIGIRGTDITAAVDTDGGYDIYVDEGKIEVANNGGKMFLTPGQGTFVKNKGIAPWHPKKWQPERLQRLRQAVHLKRGEAIRARAQNLREKRKEKLKDHLQKRQDMSPQQREQFKEKWQERLQERRDAPQGERKGNLQEKLQQRRENSGQNIRQEKLQEKIRNRRGGGDGKAIRKWRTNP